MLLRPETAQGMFINFANVLNTSRKRPPFGIAQIGKSFRNEITPGNFVFRTREFEQMEMEFFVPPADADEWYRYWCDERFRWYLELGIPEDEIRLRPHEADELSHYSSATSDVDFLFPWGWTSSRASQIGVTSTSPSTPSTRASGSTTSTRQPMSATRRTS